MRPLTRTPFLAATPFVVAAVLCVVVTAVHVDDQGGVTAFADPAWFGWGYRAIEVGALLVAGALVYASAGVMSAARTRSVWLAAFGVAAGPFAGYLLTRTTGLPGDHDDIGNWSDPVGTVSLVAEGLLMLIALAALTVRRSSTTATRYERALVDA